MNEELSDPTYPEGSVIGDFDGQGNPYEVQELLHRPHAFALMHGDGGAKIAYGHLLWRVDGLDFHFGGNSVTLGSGKCTGAGQTDTVNQPIKGLDVVIPTLNDSDGDVMDPTIPSIYHQLNGYGDVFLYWKADLSGPSQDPPTERLTECWVEVGGTTSVIDIEAVGVDNTDHDRFAGAPLADEEIAGTYRVKLGAVNVNENVTQDISSDVYWSIVVLTRYQAD